jgi:hypothetical protein
LQTKTAKEPYIKGGYMKIDINGIILGIVGWVAIIGLIGFSGCSMNFSDTPESPTLVLEKDGIKIYRFRDEGYWRYFTSKGEMNNEIGEKTKHQDTM